MDVSVILDEILPCLKIDLRLKDKNGNLNSHDGGTKDNVGQKMN